jgi:branched-chain amino acid transport system permease protein
MTRFVELLLNGISLGSIYALIALGFVIVFKATEVVNFAQGSLLVLGGYITVRAHEHLPFALALLAGVTATALAGLLIEWVFVRRVRGGDVNALAILTIGIDIVLITELTRRFGSDVLTIGDPWGSKLVHFAGLSLPEARLAAITVAAILLGLFFAAFKFSSWGVAMRAGAEDGEAAALMGIRRGRVTATAWLIAGGLAAVAAVFLTAFPSPGLDASVRDVALRAFPAAILGGLDSTAGAVVGGLAIGLAEALTAGYSVTLLGGSVADVIPYLVMLAVLLVRPSGLLGTREASRV